MGTIELAHDTARDGDVDTVAGNTLRLLTDGPARLAALLGLIEGASDSLRLLYYIYSPDRSGMRVRDALIAARRRGVAVSLIVDGFGSDADDDFFRPLKDAGGVVCRYDARFGRRFLLRNHQKLAIADEARVIVGGFNVEDDYFGTVADGAWRDLGLLVEGPAVPRLARYFDALEAWVHDPEAKMRDVRRLLERASETDGKVRWLMGGPTAGLSPWATAIKREMAAARRLDIVAAYFAPNPGMLRAIERVARRGGAARVVTAGKSDNGATIAAARHTYASLLKRGVRCFEYLATKLHTKLFLIDDAVHIGSANLDARSLYINLELMLRVEDAGFAARVRRYVEGEVADAHEITRAAHRRRGVLVRAKWALAYLLVEVLDYNFSRRLNFGLDGK